MSELERAAITNKRLSTSAAMSSHETMSCCSFLSGVRHLANWSQRLLIFAGRRKGPSPITRFSAITIDIFNRCPRTRK